MDKKELALQRFFRHFAMRLFERHGIFITYDKYLNYCTFPYLRNQKLIIKEDGRSFIKGDIKIKDKKVTVYRGDKKLQTITYCNLNNQKAPNAVSSTHNGAS